MLAAVAVVPGRERELEMTTPAQMALEYRIWAFASPRGWNVTPGEIAAELGVTTQAIRGALERRRWSSRCRVTKQDTDGWASSWNRDVMRATDDVLHGRVNMAVE